MIEQTDADDIRAEACERACAKAYAKALAKAYAEAYEACADIREAYDKLKEKS